VAGGWAQRCRGVSKDPAAEGLAGPCVKAVEKRSGRGEGPKNAASVAGNYRIELLRLLELRADSIVLASVLRPEPSARLCSAAARLAQLQPLAPRGPAPGYPEGFFVLIPLMGTITIIFRSESSCQIGSLELRFRGSSRTGGERLQFQSASRWASKVFLKQGRGSAGAAYCRLRRQPLGRVSLSKGFEAFQVVLDNSESCRVPYIPIQNLP
jgi:hypothetical protein